MKTGTLDASLYVDLDPLERLQLIVSARKRGDLEELGLIESNDPAYTERVRRFNELSLGSGWLIRGELVAYWRARATEGDPERHVSLLRAWAHAWGDLCGELGVKPADAEASCYADAYGVLSAHPEEAADAHWHAQILATWRIGWYERIAEVDIASLWQQGCPSLSRFG